MLERYQAMQMTWSWWCFGSSTVPLMAALHTSRWLQSGLHRISRLWSGLNNALPFPPDVLNLTLIESLDCSDDPRNGFPQRYAWWLKMKFFASLAALALMVIPAKSTARPMVGDLMAEKLYYAEGRQHPGHPLHGSHEGLWAGSERWFVCDWCGFLNHLFDDYVDELIDELTFDPLLNSLLN